METQARGTGEKALAASPLGVPEKNPASDMLLSEMDIDQRLDKLTERHEALTQTVELTLTCSRRTRF